MKLIIDIPEEFYSNVKNAKATDYGSLSVLSVLSVLDSIRNSTPLPDNATNGDIFLLTHPNVVATEISRKGYLFNVIQLRNKAETLPFAEIYIDWWNAPYRKEVKDADSN